MSLFATVMTYFCAGACLLLWPVWHILDLRRHVGALTRRIDVLEARELIHAKYINRLLRLETVYRTEVSPETQKVLSVIDAHPEEEAVV